MRARLALVLALCAGLFAVPAPTHAQAQGRSDGCNARARIPRTAAGEGHFVEAIVSGPMCAQAVVLYVARSPGGMPASVTGPRPVLPGRQIESVDIGPTAAVPMLAGARDAMAMTAALPGWLGERLLRQPPPSPRDDLAARLAAGETRGDCSARVVLPWPGADASGRAGYAVEVFADGTDCNNAAMAMVVRAPDGAPLYSLAMGAVGYATFFMSAAPTTPGEMAAMLRQWIDPGADTTETLITWPAGIAEGEAIRNSAGTIHMIDTGGKYTRETWTELQKARRPTFGFRVNEEMAVYLVLMPDGRVIEAATIWMNY